MKLTVRRLIRGTGQHRKVPLSDLIGKPSAYTTPPSPGVLTQAWRPCSGPCDGEMPSVLHKDGWTCGHCLTITTTTGGAK